MASIINSLTGVPALHVSSKWVPHNEAVKTNTMRFAVKNLVKNLKIHFFDE